MNSIAIISNSLCDYWHPENGFKIGGAERFCVDLGRLFEKLGYQVIYITKAHFDSERKTENQMIVTISSQNGSKGDALFSKKVYKYCHEINVSVACYSEMQIAFPFCYESSFSIQHGVYWDNPNMRLRNMYQIYRTKYTLKRTHKVVCVDTNFINWCRENSKYYFNNREKLVYIPNYADEEMFSYSYAPWDKNYYPLLFPRRLDQRRGYDLFMKVCKVLIGKGYQIEPILAFEKDKAEEFYKLYPYYKELNCLVIHPNMEEIAEWYKKSFLCLVPTLWSEGTSLSAIESISVGTPVIASDVGGLGNIILQGYNGFIVPPTVESYVSLIEKIITNPNIRNSISQNCVSMNEILGKDRWEKQIMEALSVFIK